MLQRRPSNQIESWPYVVLSATYLAELHVLHSYSTLMVGARLLCVTLCISYTDVLVNIRTLQLRYSD